MCKMTGFAKRCVLTFLIGGVTGVFGQVLVMAFGALEFEGLALPMAVLFTLGLLGCIMVLTKVSDRLERTGCSVILIAFYGMGIAMAQCYGTLRTAGASIGAAFVRTWRFFAIALVPGIAIAVLTGCIWAAIG